MQPQTIKPGRLEEVMQMLQQSHYYSLIQDQVFLTHPPGDFPSREVRSPTINEISRSRAIRVTDAEPLAGIHAEKVVYYQNHNPTFQQQQEVLARDLKEYVI